MRFDYNLLLLPAVFWSRLTLGRHTWWELISGAVIGILATLAVVAGFAVR